MRWQVFPNKKSSRHVARLLIPSAIFLLWFFSLFCRSVKPTIYAKPDHQDRRCLDLRTANLFHFRFGQSCSIAGLCLAYLGPLGTPRGTLGLTVDDPNEFHNKWSVMYCKNSEDQLCQLLFVVVLNDQMTDKTLTSFSLDGKQLFIELDERLSSLRGDDLLPQAKKQSISVRNFIKFSLRGKEIGFRDDAKN